MRCWREQISTRNWANCSPASSPSQKLKSRYSSRWGWRWKIWLRRNWCWMRYKNPREIRNASMLGSAGVRAVVNTSGVSGAGRKPSLTTSFCEVTGNFSAYSILYHRHVPEVLQICGLEEHEFSFTAQLLPLHRGILETIYFRAPSIADVEDLLAIYEHQYAAEPFVRLFNPRHM